MKGLDFISLAKTYDKLGYPFYDTGKFNVNIFGFRNSEDVVDEFNDILGICYLDDFGRPIVLAAKGTTKPGAYWLGQKMGNINGTFVLQEGYYKGCWKKGKHHGKYDCLVQAKSDCFYGYRDADKDGKVDYDGIVYKDVTGLNWHTTSFFNDKEKVGAYSAGCQVVQDDKDYLSMLPMIYKSMEKYGDSVSYALFNVKDFF